MSFGFGVGDFLATIKLANKVRTRFVDAPEQFKAVSKEVKGLSNVLRDIEDVLPQRDLTNRQNTELGEIANGCRDLLKQLEDTLDRYQDLDLATKDLDGRARRVWKRFRWDQKDIDQFRSRINSNVLLLSTFLQRITSQTSFATKDLAYRLVSHQDDQDRQIVIDWLTPTNHGAQQSDFLGRRHERTGQWLLDAPEFHTWCNGDTQTLFCPGVPGAGKTILASIVIDHLCTKHRNDSSIGIAHWYCNFRQPDEQKPIDLFSSLLKQFVQGLQSIPETVKSLYERHKRQQTRPLLGEVLNELRLLTDSYSKLFIVIDALDECRSSDGCRQIYISELIKLQMDIGLNLFVTSRFIPEIESVFAKNGISLEIRATDEDVGAYLDGHMSRLPSFVKSNLDLQREVKTGIIEAVSGVFLLAQLHLDSLVGKRSTKALRNALKKVATGSDAYDHAYEDAMKRIEGQVKDQQELAKQALSWISCAKRPLSTRELQHALAVEVGDSELDMENIPQIDDILSVCAGLVTFDEESGITRLVHYTTQEYFERTQDHWFPNAELDIVRICVCYLSFDVFGADLSLVSQVVAEDYDERIESYPLYEYAARNWGHHARKAPMLITEVMKFLGCRALVERSTQTLNFSRAPIRAHDPQYTGTVGLHVASHFGLDLIVKTLLDRGAEANLIDDSGRSPLSLAAGEGHEAVVRLLIEEGIDLDSRDRSGQTPLARAVLEGHQDIIRLLIDAGADPDIKDRRGCTPLDRAVRTGAKDLVNLLLKSNKVDIDRQYSYGMTRLHQAVQHGYNEIVMMLLEKGAAVDRKDRYGRTPLSHAIRARNQYIVESLLANNASTSTSDCIGRTPLFYVAEYGNAQALKIMLAKDDVELDREDRYGMTPLTMAVVNQHVGIVVLLLATDGVSSDSQDHFGRTPLSWARRIENPAIEGALLDGIEGKGIVVRQHESPTVGCPISNKVKLWSCSVCTLKLPVDHVWYRCGICIILICSACKAIGVQCLDDTHKVKEYTRLAGGAKSFA